MVKNRQRVYPSRCFYLRVLLEARKAVIVFTAIGLLTALVPATLGADTPSQRVHQGGGEGTGWHSHRLTSDGSAFTTTIRLEEPSRPMMLGQIAYTDGTSSGHLFGQVVIWWDSQAGAHVHVFDSTSHEVEVSTYEEHEPGEYIELAMTIEDAEANFLAVQWADAANATGFSHEVRAEEGVDLIGSKSGNETFLYQARDFEGLASVQGSTPEGGARAQILTQKTIEVENRFVGWFDHTRASEGLMTADTPDGKEECPCRPWDELSIEGSPGTYAFNLTGAGATNSGQVFLGGADVALPSSPSATG